MTMPGCRLRGHRYRFTSDGSLMTWTCEHCGLIGGTKRYPSAAEAELYARALQKRDSDDLGRRAPLIGLLPLRIWNRLRSR